MPSAICLKCGRVWFGWALENPEHRKCMECGGELKIEKVEDWCELRQRYCKLDESDYGDPCQKCEQMEEAFSCSIHGNLGGIDECPRC